jgi:hypothetical protein
MMIGMYLEPLWRKLSSALRIDRKSKAFGIFQVFRTFIIVNIGMLIFRAKTLRDAINMFKSIFIDFKFSNMLPGHHLGVRMDWADYLIVVLGVLIIFIVGVLGEKGIDIRQRIARLPFALKFVLYLAFVFVIIIFGAYGDGYGAVIPMYANF